jgi:predicted nicotinamide N-methyase
MSAHVRSVYGIKILKSKHKTLKTLKKESEQPSLYGDQIWQSSFMLMEYLEQNPLAQNQRVMDIGCGWGLLGIFCAKHFASSVLLVDADSKVFPYVNSHELLNDVSVNTIKAAFNEITSTDLAKQDVILGSDICFWPQLATQLRLLISIAIKAGVKQIIIADPGRQTFLHLAEFCKINYGAQLHIRVAAGRTKSKGYLLVIRNCGQDSPLANTP